MGDGCVDPDKVVQGGSYKGSQCLHDEWCNKSLVFLATGSQFLCCLIHEECDQSPHS